MRTDADYPWIYSESIPFNTLKGKIITKIVNRDDRVEFYTNDGRFTLISFESWCGNDVRVWLENKSDDFSGVLNSPVLLAEETSDSANGYSYTFYKLSTNKDSVTLRFCGESNGYYSEKMDFYRS